MSEKHRSNKGQAIVELALILPLFLILVMGALDFGIVYYNKAMLTNASREGARKAIQWLGKNSAGTCIPISAQSDKINNAVQNYLSGRLINFKVAAVVPSPTVTTSGDSPACDANGGTVTVRVTYTHTYMVIGPLLRLGATIPLAAQTTMNRE